MRPSSNVTSASQGRSVTSAEVAEKVKALEASNRLDTPISLATLMPDRPYRSSHNYLREQEAYFTALTKVQADLIEKYDAVLLVGGSGPIIDMVNNFRVHDVVLGMIERGRTAYAPARVDSRRWAAFTTLVGGGSGPSGRVGRVSRGRAPPSRPSAQMA